MLIIGKILRVFGNVLGRLADVVAPPPVPPPPPPPAPPAPPSEKELAHARWIADAGDRTHRLNYLIQASEIVIDLGGYEGQWASDIFSRYLCTIHVVEPVRSYAKNISNRFKNNKSIIVHECALGSKSGTLSISISGDASSAFKCSELTDTAKVVDFNSWMDSQKIKEIALLKINIEGGEFDLLEHLIATGTIKRIRNIQVQFHDFLPDAHTRMRRIQNDLSKTHEITYQYLFIWENWERKQDQNTQ